MFKDRLPKSVSEGDWRKLHYEELHWFDVSPDIVRMIHHA
jgi:hypothetical protein